MIDFEKIKEVFGERGFDYVETILDTISFRERATGSEFYIRSDGGCWVETSKNRRNYLSKTLDIGAGLPSISETNFEKIL